MATALIKKLCKENVTDRLGYQKGGIQDIKNHRLIHFTIIIKNFLFIIE